MKQVKPERVFEIAQLYSDWKNCTKCPLHNYRKQVVHFTGTIPADVLFIGEAPGFAEDSVGEVFVGRAGEKFHEILEEVQDRVGKFTWCAINAVGCIPKAGQYVTRPQYHEVISCSDRVQQLIDNIQPRVIVTMGLSASDSLDHLSIGDTQEVFVEHPSYIMRQTERTEHSVQQRVVLQIVRGIQKCGKVRIRKA